METLAKVNFSESLTPYRVSVVDERILQLYREIGAKTNNFSLLITSTIRTVKQQAEAMFLYGDPALYAAPGKEVMKVKSENSGKSKEDIIKLMSQKISDLAVKGLRVSLHCVPEEIYLKNPIIDFSISSVPNKIEFVKEAVLHKEVSRVIIPFGTITIFNSPKVLIKTTEKAIHIEHKL